MSLCLVIEEFNDRLMKVAICGEDTGLGVGIANWKIVSGEIRDFPA